MNSPYGPPSRPGRARITRGSADAAATQLVTDTGLVEGLSAAVIVIPENDSIEIDWPAVRSILGYLPDPDRAHAQLALAIAETGPGADPVAIIKAVITLCSGDDPRPASPGMGKGRPREG